MERPDPFAFWLRRFLQKLQQGSPTVLALLAHNPFPEKPPKYLRTQLYRYTYISLDKRAASGRTWQRQPLYIY